MGFLQRAEAPSYENVYRVADSFAEFLESLREIQHANEISRTIRTGTLDEVKALAERAKREAGFPEDLDILAAMYGRTDVLEYLVNVGFRSPRLVKVAAQNGQLAALGLLARLGFDFNVQDESGKTPLMLAVAFRLIEAVKTLLSFGARVDISDKHGNTALGTALQTGDKNIIAIIKQFSQERS